MTRIGKFGLHGLALAIVLLSTLSIWPAHGGTDFLPVPVKGELTANAIKVPVGLTMKIFFTTVPQMDLTKLVLEVNLPQGLKLVSGKIHEVYRNVQKGEQLRLGLQVQVVDTGHQRVVGSATVSDEPGLILRRAFLLDINPMKADKPVPRRMLDSNGKRYVIY